LLYGLFSCSTGSLGESTLMRAANAGDFDADMTVDIQQPAVACENVSHDKTEVAGSFVKKSSKFCVLMKLAFMEVFKLLL
jgi:hypothetical protein